MIKLFFDYRAMIVSSFLGLSIAMLAIFRNMGSTYDSIVTGFLTSFATIIVLDFYEKLRFYFALNKFTSLEKQWIGWTLKDRQLVKHGSHGKYLHNSFGTIRYEGGTLLSIKVEHDDWLSGEIKSTRQWEGIIEMNPNNLAKGTLSYHYTDKTHEVGVREFVVSKDGNTIFLVPAHNSMYFINKASEEGFVPVYDYGIEIFKRE